MRTRGGKKTPEKKGHSKLKKAGNRRLKIDLPPMPPGGCTAVKEVYTERSDTAPSFNQNQNSYSTEILTLLTSLSICSKSSLNKIEKHLPIAIHKANALASDTTATRTAPQCPLAHENVKRMGVALGRLPAMAMYCVLPEVTVTVMGDEWSPPLEESTCSRSSEFAPSFASSASRPATAAAAAASCF